MAEVVKYKNGIKPKPDERAPCRPRPALYIIHVYSVYNIHRLIYIFCGVRDLVFLGTYNNTPTHKYIIIYKLVPGYNLPESRRVVQPRYISLVRLF